MKIDQKISVTNAFIKKMGDTKSHVTINQISIAKNTEDKVELSDTQEVMWSILESLPSEDRLKALIDLAVLTVGEKMKIYSKSTEMAANYLNLNHRAYFSTIRYTNLSYSLNRLRYLRQ